MLTHNTLPFSCFTMASTMKHWRNEHLARQDLSNSVISSHVVDNNAGQSLCTSMSLAERTAAPSSNMDSASQSQSLTASAKHTCTTAQQLLSSRQLVSRTRISGESLRGAMYTTKECTKAPISMLSVSATSKSSTVSATMLTGSVQSLTTRISSRMLESSHLQLKKRTAIAGNSHTESSSANIPSVSNTCVDLTNLDSFDIDVPRDTREFRLVSASSVVAVTDDAQKECMLAEQKMMLANAMASSLIGSPDYYAHGEGVIALMEALAPVLEEDPEFILKLALYTRCELNIRITANWLLAIVAAHPRGKNFLRKYFCKSIRLPSDWIEVAQLYQATCLDGDLKMGSLPTALRKSMVDKFSEFDEYQLGKYNKNVSAKDKATGKICFTLKQLIRKLHIVKPVGHVLGILGKKYPSSHEEFVNMGMEGDFDASRAGTRMRYGFACNYTLCHG